MKPIDLKKIKEQESKIEKIWIWLNNLDDDFFVSNESYIHWTAAKNFLNDAKSALLTLRNCEEYARGREESD